MYSIQNNNTTDHCHRSLSTSSSSPRLSSDVQAAKKAAATHVCYWELFPASYWALSIFFYLLHVKPTTRSRGINRTHVSPKVGHHHLYPNCCLQILQEIHKKCKACLESKEHLQLEKYFLACVCVCNCTRGLVMSATLLLRIRFPYYFLQVQPCHLCTEQGLWK